MSLPVIRGTSAALYPFTATYSFLTLVGEMQNGYQQRSVKRQGIVRFELPYAKMTQSQKNTIKAAVTSAKGQFDTTLSLVLGATTYTNLSLDADDFEAVESVTKQYNAPLRLTQTIPQGITIGIPTSPFPALSNGTMGVLPFTQGKRFQSIVTKMEAGPKYTFAEFGGGLAGYPTDGLMHWSFDESMLSDTDTAIRVNHFCNNYGKAYKFPFTDEDGNVYTAAHYATDELVVQYMGVNNSRLKVSLEVTNN